MTGDDLIALASKLAPMIELRPSAGEAALAAAEAQLGVVFPSELRAFLARTDGATIAVAWGSRELIPRALPLVWDLEEIVVENTSAFDGAPDRPTEILWFAKRRRRWDHHRPRDGCRRQLLIVTAVLDAACQASLTHAD